MDKNTISKGLCCLVGIGLFSYIGFKVVDIIAKRDLFISVKGLSDRIVASDVATCTILIERDVDQFKTVQESRQQDKKLVSEFLKRKGFSESAIEIGSPNINNNFRYSEKVEGKSKYTIYDKITVKSSDIDLMKKSVVELVTYMDSHGTGIVTCETKYRYTDMEKLRVDMLREATMDSQNRAKHIAQATGTKITGLRNLVTGQFSIVSAESSADSNDDWEGRDAIMKRLRVVVTTSFNIE
jgi:hypothetical protein